MFRPSGLDFRGLRAHRDQDLGSRVWGLGLVRVLPGLHRIVAQF